jgi:UDP-N-acetylglucosamine--N-acetylmuramyl-(pentapeptide) pyrophosphoryl-undecaprenol N-acetylglucosamine transferase
MPPPTPPHLALACGGTGGHLFPGVAVGEAILALGGSVTLLVSEKEIDQQAVRGLRDMEVVTLPAVGLQGRNYLGFAWGAWRSRRRSLNAFRRQRPAAVLAMGGFTSVGPILAARAVGAIACLHESNTVPGRANRWLSRLARVAFTGFPQAGASLHVREVVVTGTPVRTRFQPLPAAACRLHFGLDPEAPVLAVMGGSQGATGLNQAVIRALAVLQEKFPTLQYLHLTGERDLAAARAAYAAAGVRAWVEPFCAEMEQVLGAATAVVARSGASTLAEFAALGVPSVLVPFPAATDNHQFHNAAAFAASGAAVVLEQYAAVPDGLARALAPYLADGPARLAAAQAAAAWHRPEAAADIAARLWELALGPGRTVRPAAAPTTGHSFLTP